MKKKIIAWLCVMVMAFGLISVASAAPSCEVSIDGASIRTENPQGLRFKITVTNASEATDYGIVLSYAGNTRTISLAEGYTNIYASNDDEDIVEYTAVLYNIPVSAYTTEVEAYGFVTDANGTTKTQTISRNIEGVANAAGYEFEEGGVVSDMGGTEVALNDWGSNFVDTLSDYVGKVVNVSFKVRVQGVYGISQQVYLQGNTGSDYPMLSMPTLTSSWTSINVRNYAVPEGFNGIYFGNVSELYEAGAKLFVTGLVVEEQDLSGNVEIDLSTANNGYGSIITNNTDGSLTLAFDNAYGQVGFALGAVKLENYSSIEICYTKISTDSQFQFKITDGGAAYASPTETVYPGYGVDVNVEKTEIIDITAWQREGATHLLLGANNDVDFQIVIHSITLCE